jgi:uncharacterized protein YlxP (DUF503 family)
MKQKQQELQDPYLAEFFKNRNAMSLKFGRTKTKKITNDIKKAWEILIKELDINDINT